MLHLKLMVIQKEKEEAEERLREKEARENLLREYAQTRQPSPPKR